MKKTIVVICLISLAYALGGDNDDPNDYQGDAVYWREQAEQAKEELKERDLEDTIKAQTEEEKREIKALEDIENKSYYPSSENHDHTHGCGIGACEDRN